MSFNGKLAFLTAIVMMVSVTSIMRWGIEGERSELIESRDSPIVLHYGIEDMIADKAYKLLENRSREKAEFISYWFLQDGPDGEDGSYDDDHLYPLPEDNFLAWTDDGPEGVTVEYFINNPEPGQDPQTDAVQYSQMLANRSVKNLTDWMIAGKGTEDSEDIRLMHAAAYNLGKMSKYVSKMALFGHTDYSKKDQLSSVPTYHPTEIERPYRYYYEEKTWNNPTMEILYSDFWNNGTFDVPEGPGGDKVHRQTSGLAKWVNGRGEPPVQMVDHDSSTITIGYNYKRMLDDFSGSWESGDEYKGARGFTPMLWNLTVENMIFTAENLSSIYESIYDDAWASFMERAPELRLVNWSASPQPTIAGDMVTVNATVTNEGGLIAENFRLLIEGPDGFINWRGMTLQPGETKNISFLPFQVGTEPVDFTITLDYQRVIAESNEENNEVIGTIDPIPELHSSELALAAPFEEIRRDSSRKVEVDLINQGNRMDTFNISATSNIEGLEVTIQDPTILVGSYSRETMVMDLECDINTSLINAVVSVTAVGLNSTSELDIGIQILERSTDPVPVVTGRDWGRLGQNITLSAVNSSDPDGDPLEFTWIIPLLPNSTSSEITVQYNEPGVYEIELIVFDGNVSSSLIWPLRIYPQVPENISAGISGVGVSGITVSWEKWNAGGLKAYWLKATSLEDQGNGTGKGPYIQRYGPGNRSGRIGMFLPQTSVEITLTVEALDFGNVTMSTLITETDDLSEFRESLELYIENSYLYLKYKPWVDPEGEREPDLVVQRLYEGEFRDIETQKQDIQKTAFQDTLRYPLGSNTGSYRADLRYFWDNTSVSPFDLSSKTERPNRVPDLNLTGQDENFRLNINGTCRVWIVLGVDDPMDTMNVSVSWGDGDGEGISFLISEERTHYESLFHNYTETGTYDISIMVEDWQGADAWINDTVEIKEYQEIQQGEEEERSVWAIVGIVLLGIFIVVILVVLGFIAYKVSKKDTEVEFKMKDFGSELEKDEAGTGTDFDQRRGLQIPTDSIMGKKRSSDDKATMKKISGTVTFDDEE